MTTTNRSEIIKNDQEDRKNESNTPVSACGCDTDHHGGRYISSMYRNKRIYFCAENCKEEFLDDPETFLASSHFVLEFDLLEDA